MALSSVSTSFQAGHTAGKALAITHAIQGKTGSEVLTPSDKAAQSKAAASFSANPGKVISSASPYNLAGTGGTGAATAPSNSDSISQLLTLLSQNQGQTPAQLSTQAQSLAKQDVAAQVAAYQQQQQAATQQAAQRAAQINLASQAAAAYINRLGIPAQTASDFSNAAAAERAGALGYTGQLQQTASDAAAKVQAGLNAIGAPTGQAPSTTQAAQLGNVLYGLGGQIPASVLDVAGPAAAAAQRTLPASTLAYGQQEALGQIGAGAQQAATLTPDIVNAQAQLPKVASQYLSQLTSSNNDAVTQNREALSLAALVQNENATQTLNQQKAATTSAYDNGRLTVAQQNAQTAAARAASSASQTAQKQASLAAYGGLSPASQRVLISSATSKAESLAKSTPDRITLYKGQPTTITGTGTQPTQYADARNTILAMGPPNSAAWVAKANQIMNAAYAKYLPTLIAGAVKNAVTSGYTLAQATAELKQTGLPMSTVTPALRAAYAAQKQNKVITTKAKAGTLFNIIPNGQPTSSFSVVQ